MGIKAGTAEPALTERPLWSREDTYWAWYNSHLFDVLNLFIFVLLCSTFNFYLDPMNVHVCACVFVFLCVSMENCLNIATK